MPKINPNANINPIILLALSKVDVDKAIRKTIAANEYVGRATVEIEYDLKVGSDFEQVVSQSIPWQRLACLALSKLNGVSIEAVVLEAVELDTPTQVMEEIAERAKSVVEELQTGATKTVAGKVTGNVNILEVSMP